MNNNYLNIARTNLMQPYNIDDKILLSMLDKLMSKGADYADIYFQYSENEAWTLDDGIIKSGSYSIDKGVGVRSIYHDKTSFAHSGQINIENINTAIATNLSLAHQNANIKINDINSLHMHEYKILYCAHNPLISITNEQKIELLNYIDKKVRTNQYIKNVDASLASEYEIVLIVRTDGRIAADIRPLVRLNINITVEKNSRFETGSCGGGGRFDYLYFDYAKVDEYIQQALDIAYTNLEATDAPAGDMPVVLGSGWPAVLLHEAIGHGLEGDFNRKGSSIYSNKIGTKVAAEGVTILDDGTLENKRGSISIDDEGNSSQRNVLIEDGILVNYLQDEMNARLMKRSVTGNGRRENYECIPMPRMTNTYMLGGKYDPEEIISSVKNGIYAANFEGGEVDITNGKFVFSASQAFLIENGKITKPVKGVTLIGSGPDILNYVSMVGNDFALDKGVGVCGKSGQSVPVGVGQPTLLIDKMTVGGTSM